MHSLDPYIKLNYHKYNTNPNPYPKPNSTLTLKTKSELPNIPLTL